MMQAQFLCKVNSKILGTWPEKALQLWNELHWALRPLLQKLELIYLLRKRIIKDDGPGLRLLYIIKIFSKLLLQIFNCFKMEK